MCSVDKHYGELLSSSYVAHHSFARASEFPDPSNPALISKRTVTSIKLISCEGRYMYQGVSSIDTYIRSKDVKGA